MFEPIRGIILDPPFAGITMVVWLLPALAVVVGIVLMFSRRKTLVPTPNELIL